MNLLKHVPERLRLWLPPLIGIPAMLALAWWSEVAWFLLFAHHLFWMMGSILLINPVLKTFPPPVTHKNKTRPAAPKLAAKSRPR
ncbi:MAG: hypothetical protein DYG89_11460 [Caldilinea sp. CFX5]|nr:hypothetical protein [Caldilinea sp. CFX5]